MSLAKETVMHQNRTQALRYLLAAALIFAPVTALAAWDPNDPATQNQPPAGPAQKVAITIKQFLDVDPGLQRFFDKAYGYAVFPSIAKGGVGIGGASGRGYVYQQGQLIGLSRASQFTIGAQLGGLSFSQVIFFKDQAALDDFKGGKFVFGASATAIAASSGAASHTDYSRGVAIFTITRNGLMAEAAIGGMKFTFRPVKSSQ